jgi:branched-chain amino acid transport system substrate-binding protein
MLGRRVFTVTMASLVAASALGASALGCGKKGPSGDSGSPSASPAEAAAEWKVGAFLSLSGAETQFGVDTKEGIELAVDEVNKAGGAKGKPIKVVFEDDKSNPNEANNKVLQLISRDKVVAILGEVASSRSKPGGIVANKNKIPMITPSSTNPDVTKIGPFVFRVCFTDDIQGQMGAQFIVTTMGKKKVGLFYASDDLYSSGLANEFRAEAKKLGAEIVVEKSFLKTETNFTTFINEIRDAKPDLIYAPIYYSSMGPIARQAKASGLKGDMFVGGDGWHSDSLLETAGEEMEGAYFTTHFTPDAPWATAKTFVEKYKERFKHEPTALAAMGYDAAKVLADAISRSKADTPDSIREAIQDTKGFQGASGSITINAERNADKPIVIAQVKGKKFTYYATVGGPK